MISNLLGRLKSKLSLVILLSSLIILIILLFLSRQSSPSNSNLNPTPTPTTTPSPESTTFSSPEPFKFSSLDLIKSNQLFAINQQNSSLIKITPEETATIYSNPVKAFSYQGSKLAIIDQTKKNGLLIHDLNTDQNSSLPLSSIAPLIDVSYHPQGEGLYLLANLDLDNRTTDLFYLPPNSPDPQKITTSKATSLEALSDQNILLFSFADAQDLSTISIFNLPNLQESFSIKANSYFISPSKNSICIISSTKVTLLDLNNQVPKTYQLKAVLGAYWTPNSELVLVRNTFKGVTQATITPLTNSPSFKLIPSLKDKNLRSIIGYQDNQLYAIDYFNHLIKISL